MATRPGERKLQILQTLAGMLEAPAREKITTAALAARLDCSEAALYRHFASKAQMFEGLIEFIEGGLFGVINQITREETDGLRQTELIVDLLLRFATKNRGMTRVLLGDVLVNEHERLQARINQLTDKLEATLRQCLRIAVTGNRLATETDIAGAANLLLCYAIGRWHGYARSGFTREPGAQWPQQWHQLCAGLLLAPPGPPITVCD